MFWGREQAVIHTLSGEPFILHEGFIYYLSHLFALLFLCLIALAFLMVLT